MLAEWSGDRERGGGPGEVCFAAIFGVDDGARPCREAGYSEASRPDCEGTGLQAAGSAFPAEGGACSEGLGRQGPGASGDLTAGQSGDPRASSACGGCVVGAAAVGPTTAEAAGESTSQRRLEHGALRAFVTCHETESIRNPDAVETGEKLAALKPSSFQCNGWSLRLDKRNSPNSAFQKPPGGTTHVCRPGCPVLRLPGTRKGGRRGV